jgi:hypothetical protein
MSADINAESESLVPGSFLAGSTLYEDSNVKTAAPIPIRKLKGIAAAEFRLFDLDDPPLARARLNRSSLGRFLDAPISILNLIVSFRRPEPGRLPRWLDRFVLLVELHVRGRLRTVY